MGARPEKQMIRLRLATITAAAWPRVTLYEHSRYHFSSPSHNRECPRIPEPRTAITHLRSPEPKIERCPYAVVDHGSESLDVPFALHPRLVSAEAQVPV